jgi:glycosyltransferase involved in cell wall biosynthesis
MIAYNHERFIGEAVRSILGQTYRDFELIIVDDGSTDATGDVIRGVRDDRIVYIRQQNRGPSEARNTALRMARGALVAQMSGDDVAEPTRIERQVAYHGAHPNSVIFTHFVFIGEDGLAINHPRWQHLAHRSNATRDATLRHLYFEGNCFLAPSALTARSAFEAAGPYNPVMLQLQDYDMWVRLLLRGYDPHIIQEPLMRHRIRAHGANLSDSTPEAKTRSYFEMQRLLRRFLTIDTAQWLLEIFPEAKALPYPLHDDLVPFLLAVLGLESKGHALQAFAADLLLEMMEDEATRNLLSDKARFTLVDMFRLIGQIDPFHVNHLQRRGDGLQKQLNDLVDSRTWRVARALRDLTSGMRALFERR